MNTMIFSCKDCTDRHPCCHSTCQKYLQEKARNEEVRKKAQEFNREYYAFRNTNGVEWGGGRRRRKRR